MAGREMLRRILSRRARQAPAPGNEIISLRLLHRDSRTRIFFTAARIGHPHTAVTEGWRRVLHHMRPDDRIIWTTYWTADEAYFRFARDFHKDLPVPRKNIWVLGNTREETEAAAACGFRSSWVHNNCWLDETVFRPIARPKQYRAIMIAQNVDYKRPWLAARVDGLAYVETERFHLSNPAVIGRLNPAARFSSLPTRELVDLINASRTGLILSDIEGGCFASSECLMCGIPVVSTPSVGGRDVYYDEGNSLIVEPTEDAVAAGVERMISRPADPTKISSRHAELSREFRDRFAREVIATIFAETGSSTAPEKVIEMGRRNKMADFIPERLAVDLIRESA